MAKKYNLSRVSFLSVLYYSLFVYFYMGYQEVMDEYSVNSHHKAAQAIEANLFKDVCVRLSLSILHSFIVIYRKYCPLELAYMIPKRKC